MKSKSNSQNTLHYLSIFFLISSLVFTFFSIFSGYIDPHLFTNSDASYLGTLYKSMFVDKVNFSGWVLPDAPFLFPDFLIYTLLFKLFDNYFLTSGTTALLIFISIICSIVILYRIIFIQPKYENKKLLISSALYFILSLFVLLIGNKTLFLQTIFLLSPVFHEGMIFISLISLILILNLLKNSKGTKWPLAIIFLLSTLITAFDKSFFKDFTTPMVATILLYYVLDRNLFKKLKIIPILLIAATLFGHILYTALIPYPNPFVDNPVTADISNSETIKRNLEGMSKTLGGIFTQKELSINVGAKEFSFVNTTAIGLAILVFVIVYASYLIIKSIYGKELSQKPIINFFSIFVIIQTGSNLFSVIARGYFRSMVHTRYFSAVILSITILGIILLMDLLANLSKMVIKKTLLILLSATSIVLILSIYKVKSSTYVSLKSYKPPHYECVSNIASKYNIKYGLASLWLANTTSLYSNGALNIFPMSVTDNVFIPSHWISNTDYYLHDLSNTDKLPEYEMILTKFGPEQSTQNIVQFVGEPNYFERCPTTDVLIYKNDTSKNKIKNAIKSYFTHVVIDENGGTLEILGEDFNNIYYERMLSNELSGPYVVENNFIKSKDNQAGVIAFGPELVLEKGLYNVQLTYSTTADNPGYLEVHIFPPREGSQVKLINTNGDTQTLSGTIEVGKGLARIKQNSANAGVVRFKFVYSGNGELTLEKLVITKEKN